MPTLAEIQLNHASVFILRDPTTYDFHANLVSTDATLSKTYGIKGSSVFNRLRYNHIMTMLPPDITHDYCEGVIPLVLQLVLSYFINERKFFSLHFLNSCLKAKNFHKLDKRNIFGFIPNNFATRSSGIGGTAAKNFALLRFLPYLIGNLVPYDDPIFWILCSLHDIVQVVFSECFDEFTICLLDDMLKEFRVGYLAYLHRPISPKMHFCEHYPHHIRNFGPPISYRTLRYESKHQYFKQIAVTNKNFLNICYTMARKHQLLTAFYLASPCYFKPIVRVEDCFPANLENFSPSVRHLLMTMNGQNLDSLMQCNSVFFEEMEYICGCFLIHGGSDPVPEYCKISQIFLSANEVQFLCCHYLSHFNDTLRCFELTRTDTFHLLTPSTMQDFLPHHGYLRSGKLYIIPKRRTPFFNV